MKIIMVRHGESEGNSKNIFTGWLDYPLTKKGEAEAKKSAKKLISLKLEPNIVFTSMLKRAIKTTNIILEEENKEYLPVIKNWRLNERHYGKLQGERKDLIAKRYGDKQVMKWRRGYNNIPPQADNAETKAAYESMDIKCLPKGESLRDTVLRVLPFWNDILIPSLRDKDVVLIVAHGNSIRALYKIIQNISDEDITKVNIDTGEIIVISLDDNLSVVDSNTFL